MKRALAVLFLISALISCKAQTKKVITKVVDVSTFKEGLTDKAVQLVDVRTPAEFEEGHIKNALLIDYYNEDFRKNILKLDRDRPIYLYCRSGNRSGKATLILKELGFTEIIDLGGGYLDWSKTIKHKE